MTTSNNGKALKSGLWYIVANFITKSIIFLSTPIFARLLTHEEYGLYSNYTSWLSTFTVFVTLNLSSTFISARFDFKDKFDTYISSITCLSIISSLAWTIIINLFSSSIVKITSIEMKHLNIMMLYMLFTGIIDMFQTREKYYFEYKVSVALSLLISVGGTLLSILFVSIMSDKLSARILGNSLLNIILGGILLAYIMYKGKRVQIQYWRYALPICLPYIPHLLSLTILNSVDRIMITKICGAGDTALYSLAYSCGAIVTLLITSMNTAFAPWLGEKLDNNIEEIRKASIIYVTGFCFLACGLMLISPEVLLLMGGKGYSGTLFVMPPIAYGFVCQFIYTMYVNIEQFKKKTIGMAIASVSSAILNYILNAVFIPKYGYIVAAYTTLVSFIWLLAIHVYLVKRIGYIDVYNFKGIIKALFFVSIFTIVVNFLYMYPIIRYVVISAYAILFLLIIKKYGNTFISILRKNDK